MMRRSVVLVCLCLAVFQAGCGKKSPVAPKPDPVIMPADSLIGYWRGENNALDSSGHGLDGDFVGTPAYVQGIRGRAFHFDGASGVNVPYHSAWELGGDASVVFWVKLDQAPDPGARYSPTFIGQDDGSGCYLKWFLYEWLNGGGLNFLTHDVSTCQLHGAGWDSQELQVGVWSHFAMVKSGTNLSLYKDGVLVSSQALDSQVFGTDGVLRFGWLENDGWTQHTLRGAMDEVAFYGRALTAAEVTRVVAVGRAG
jgi:uncharacterized protein